MTPFKLVLPSKINEKFKFISSGEDHNFAITQLGLVYGFGKNSYNKIKSIPKENVYFELIDIEERCSLASCGPFHSVVTDLKGIPYTWGNSANGRCG